MVKLDPDGSGSIETAEFVDAMLLYITSKAREYAEARRASAVDKGEEEADGGDDDDEDDEEDVEIPDDLQELDWQEQQRHVKMRAAKMMGVGTGASTPPHTPSHQSPLTPHPSLTPHPHAPLTSRTRRSPARGVVCPLSPCASSHGGVPPPPSLPRVWSAGLILIFSDPMVDVMSNMGERLGIPPFYVAFVLAPLASNASEFIASYSYAQKKTQKTITVALAALEGAACMNNTFCLAIFMGVSRRARAPRARARPRPRPRSPSLCTRTRTRTRRDACLERSRGWPCPATARHAHPPPSCADRPPARTRHDPSASVSQLVFFKQLAWKYSAETITTLVVQVIVGCVALRPTMPLWIALALLALFPASIVMIAALEAIGLD